MSEAVSLIMIQSWPWGSQITVKKKFTPSILGHAYCGIVFPSLLNIVNPFLNWKGNLKLVSAIFYQIFSFSKIIALQKLWKMFFISSKKLFSFLRFFYFRLHLFFSLSAIVLEIDPR